MRKVVYNACYGGASLSREAVLLGRKLSGNEKWMPHSIKGDVYPCGAICDSDFGHLDDTPRHDDILVKVVETLGERASGFCSKLKVTEVSGPYRIEEYDGFESVETPDSYYWVE